MTKRLGLAFLLAFAPASLFAQITVYGPGGAGGSFSSPVSFADGTCAAPSITWTSQSGYGWYRAGSGITDLCSSGNVLQRLTGASIVTTNAGSYNWASANADGTIDTRLMRDAAATVQLGADVNGAAVAQTLKAHDGITGTDVNGANLTTAGGRGTGAGLGGNLRFQTSPSLATGTTAQTLSDRDLIVAAQKALVDNTATTFVEIAVPTETTTIVHVYYSVEAEDATDQQVIGGIATVAIINDAGTEACGTITEAGETTAVSTGTITATITCQVGLSSVVNLQMTSDSSLNVAPVLAYRVMKNGGTGAITPQ